MKKKDDNGLPRIHRDMAIYSHKLPWDTHWTAKAAGRDDVTGTGNTRLEAFMACEKALNDAVDKQAMGQVEDDPFHEVVGVFHVA